MMEAVQALSSKAYHAVFASDRNQDASFRCTHCNKSLARAVTIGQAARVDLAHTNKLQHVAQSGAQVYTWQKTELFADAQVHQESMEECKSFVKKVIEATDDRFPNRNQLTDLDIFDPTAVPGTEEAPDTYGTEELKRLHVLLPDQATRLAAALGYNFCPTEPVGLHRFRTRQVHRRTLSGGAEGPGQGNMRVRRYSHLQLHVAVPAYSQVTHSVRVMQLQLPALADFCNYWSNRYSQFTRSHTCSLLATKKAPSAIPSI